MHTRPYLVRPKARRKRRGEAWRKQRFEVGEAAPADGIYAVAHREHRLWPEITLTAGSRFPGCAGCEEPVWFQFVRPVTTGQEFQIQLYVLPVMEETEEIRPEKAA